MDQHYKVALSFATEDQDLVEKVYHYLKAEKIDTFFAPSPEGQVYLSGKNQREVFYDIFGLNAEYVALFVSKYYVAKEIPMEEASIAFANHADTGSVIPVYLDGTSLPLDLFRPEKTNYFKENNPAMIAKHLAAKIKQTGGGYQGMSMKKDTGNNMISMGNLAEKQIFIQDLNGSIEL